MLVGRSMETVQAALLLVCLLVGVVKALNDRPIIGILSQEPDIHIQNHYPNYTSYIAASYVKFLESSGSRVVPIWIKQSPQYYAHIINSVNALLIPGGAALFNATDGYAAAGWELYKLAKQKNDAGVYFPIWGTCLGFELLAVLSANRTDLRTVCHVHNISMPLTFKQDYRSSKLYKEDTDGVLGFLQKQNLTFNTHHWCITEKNMTATGVADQWHVLSVNEHNGSEFISSFEHKKYPFYGVQFHPEKNAFEWNIASIPHSAEAILAEQFFGNFFVNEARKNNNSFSNTKQERAALIYNYPVTYTGDKEAFEQIYFFTEEQQVFRESTSTSTSISTTTTATTTITTTSVTTTTTRTETVTGSKAVSAGVTSGVTSAQTKDKPNAAAAHSPLAYVTVCIAMCLTWVVRE